MKLKVFRYKNVQSTNSTARRIIKKTNLSQGMIISEIQKKGRGQYGRKWISYKGNLFVSFFYICSDLSNSLGELTKFNCLLVKKLLEKYYKKLIIFKKPNDLLIKKKKICGILQETIKKNGKTYLIVGIGINLIKSPNIKNYPTINLKDLISKNLIKSKIENDLKKTFEINMKKLATYK